MSVQGRGGGGEKTGYLHPHPFFFFWGPVRKLGFLRPCARHWPAYIYVIHWNQRLFFKVKGFLTPLWPKSLFSVLLCALKWAPCVAPRQSLWELAPPSYFTTYVWVFYGFWCRPRDLWVQKSWYTAVQVGQRCLFRNSALYRFAPACGTLAFTPRAQLG